MVDQESLKCDSDVSLRRPACMHRVLTAAEVAGRQVLIVGDVHGCLDELKALLSRCGSTADNSVVVLCGDMINKGPKNCETLAYVRGRKEYIYAVRGNHEEHVLKHWLQHAQDSEYVLKEKYQWIRELSRDDVDYLHELPYTISIPTLNAVVVHAGLLPGTPLLEQDCTDMLFMRNIDFSDGTPRSSKQTLVGEAWGSFWAGPQHVYYGHDAKRRLQKYLFATCLDTGCVYGGELTAQIISPVLQLVSVAANETYRDPKGS